MLTTPISREKGEEKAKAGLPSFPILALRLTFTPLDPLKFGRSAANSLRGGLGFVLQKLACGPLCSASIHHPACLYAQVFEPRRSTFGPSGLAELPRPFVFRVRHLNQAAFEPGQSFEIGLNLFSLDPGIRDLLVLALAQLGEEGFGPRRARAAYVGQALPPVHDVLSLAPRLRVVFASPTELKHNGEIASQPDFPILMARIRDRVATLSQLYGSGPIDLDFAAFGARAASVRMTRCELQREEVNRRSSRTGQVHSLGGFTGFADYEGDLSEFLPWLAAAQWTGVGRHAVWGNGEIHVESPVAIR